MIALFNGIRNLMKADSACRESGLNVTVMPVPHTYSTECGMSLIVAEKDLELFLEIVNNLKIAVELKSNY